MRETTPDAWRKLKRCDDGVKVNGHTVWHDTRDCEEGAWYVQPYDSPHTQPKGFDTKLLAYTWAKNH